jgi:type IV pilus assembly protein PilW
MMSRTRGFSLVELMVAVTLGSLIVLAAVQLLVVNQRTFLTQQNTSRLLDDGQLVLRFMANDLRQAGASIDGVPVPAPVPFGAGLSASVGALDRLAIRYRGTQDCQGSEVAAPVTITNVYRVTGGQLRCGGSLTAGEVTLVNGVEGFKVLYGLDRVKDEFPGPFSYVNASTAQASGRPIVALRIGLLLSVDSPSLPVGTASTWRLYNTNINRPADTRMRRAFYTTVMLRNVDWEEI